MSDFDKEAEREKLREKYGDEEEKRAATEQMSELLLKGATMTNAHCTDCGDPIFRYDGQEFCPTCQKPVARDQPGDDADGEDGDHIEVADPSDDATVQFGAEEEPPETRSQDGPENRDPAADSSPGAPSADPDRTPGESTPPTDAMRSDASASTDAVGSDASASTDAVGSDASASTPDPSSAPTPTQRRGSAGGSVTDELSAAESLLAETVHRFARRAADTDDPRRAREQLAAAREAAEALEAVRF